MSRIADVHVINLKRRPDRMERFLALSGLKPHEYHRFDAKDGLELHWTKQLEQLFRTNTFGSLANPIGCALSHYLIWERIAAAGDEMHMVLEDDNEFIANWIDKWNVEYYPKLPKDAFVLDAISAFSFECLLIQYRSSS